MIAREVAFLSKNPDRQGDAAEGVRTDLAETAVAARAVGFLQHPSLSRAYHPVATNAATMATLRIALLEQEVLDEPQVGRAVERAVLPSGGPFTGVRIVVSFVLHYTVRMARPRGRTKPARLTVNLDRATYCALNELAHREDVSVSWVVRRAIEALLTQDRVTGIGPTVGASTPQIDRTPASETALR